MQALPRVWNIFDEGLRYGVNHRRTPDINVRGKRKVFCYRVLMILEDMGRVDYGLFIFSRKEKCLPCDGTGKFRTKFDDGYVVKTCTFCNGKGFFLTSIIRPNSNKNLQISVVKSNDNGKYELKTLW